MYSINYLSIYLSDPRGTATNLQIVLNTQKDPYLNQATQKNTCQNFLPKRILESKISNPKKSFDHPRHLESSPPPPPLVKLGYSTFWARNNNREKVVNLLAVLIIFSALKLPEMINM